MSLCVLLTGSSLGLFERRASLPEEFGHTVWVWNHRRSFITSGELTAEEMGNLPLLKALFCLCKYMSLG